MMTLRRVEAPTATENPELTQGVYRGLEALLDFYVLKQSQNVHFWRLILARLHEVPVADLHLAQAVSHGLEDLAWHYDAYDWRQDADGWRRTARVVLERALMRERRRKGQA